MNQKQLTEELAPIYIYFDKLHRIENKITKQEFDIFEDTITAFQYYNNLYEKGKNTWNGTG